MNRPPKLFFFNPYKNLDYYSEINQLSVPEKNELIHFCKSNELKTGKIWSYIIGALALLSIYAIGSSVISEYNLAEPWGFLTTLAIFMVCFMGAGYLLGLGRHLAFSDNLNQFLAQH